MSLGCFSGNINLVKLLTWQVEAQHSPSRQVVRERPVTFTPVSPSLVPWMDRWSSTDPASPEQLWGTSDPHMWYPGGRVPTTFAFRGPQLLSKYCSWLHIIPALMFGNLNVTNQQSWLLLRKFLSSDEIFKGSKHSTVQRIFTSKQRQPSNTS